MQKSVSVENGTDSLKTQDPKTMQQLREQAQSENEAKATQEVLGYSSYRKLSTRKLFEPGVSDDGDSGSGSR